MKYILLMSGKKAGVDSYKAWSEKDIQNHFAHRGGLASDLSKSGEFVATDGLDMPQQAKVVRAGKDHAADHRWRLSRGKGIFLGYWIVDVDSAERAYEIAARISGGPGPGGITLNMPIEGRQIMIEPLRSCRDRVGLTFFEHLLRELAPQVLGVLHSPFP